MTGGEVAARALAIVRDILLIIVLVCLLGVAWRAAAALDDYRDRATGAAMVTEPDPAACAEDLGVLGC